MPSEQRGYTPPKGPKVPDMLDTPPMTLDTPPEGLKEGPEDPLDLLEVEEKVNGGSSTLPPKDGSEEKPFRLAARRLFLTYPQMPEEMTKEDVLESLRKVVDFQSYVISREQHAQEGVHFHVILNARRKFDIKSSHLLDLIYKDKTYHGQYQTIKFYDSCVEYVCKHGDYKTNLLDLVNGKIASLPKQFLERAKRDGTDEAMRWYIEVDPVKAAGGCSGNKLLELNAKIVELENKLKMKQKIPPYPSLDQYNLLEELSKWIEAGCQPTLILYGEGGTEKTSFDRSLAFVEKLKMLIVTHRDDLKRYDDSY